MIRGVGGNDHGVRHYAVHSFYACDASQRTERDALVVKLTSRSVRLSESETRCASQARTSGNDGHATGVRSIAALMESPERTPSSGQ